MMNQITLEISIATYKVGIFKVARKIPFLNLKRVTSDYGIEIEAAISKVINSGDFILGEELGLFEDEFREFCQVNYALGVGNGLDALRLSLLAMGVGHGDEVIVPSNTFIATWLAVSQCGATPVPVDPDLFTYTMSPAKVEKLLTKRTKAIIPVHLYGHPADLNPIIEIAKKNNIFVLEDAAQAHGAEYNNQRIGGHGDIVAWSFYPGKNLGALGDGGAITTNNEFLYNKIRLLRNYGSTQKYHHSIIGFNSRLDEIQAAVLRIKLRHLQKNNAYRAKLAAKYNFLIKPTDDLILPKTAPWALHAWHLYVIRHKSRGDLMERLEDAGIETMIHYPIPPSSQEAYKSQFSNKLMTPAFYLSDEVLSLPLNTSITEEDVSYISTVINN